VSARRRGFSLLEVMLAAGLLGLVAIALLGAVVESSARGADADDERRLSFAAHAKLEELIAGPDTRSQGRFAAPLDAHRFAYARVAEPWSQPDDLPPIEMTRHELSVRTSAGLAFVFVRYTRPTANAGEGSSGTGSSEGSD